MGAGKTAFVRGLARGIGVDPAEVASPTFVLLTTYPGRLALRFARVKSHRLDKTAAEADTFRTIQQLYREMTGLEAPAR